MERAVHDLVFWFGSSLMPKNGADAMSHVVCSSASRQDPPSAYSAWPLTNGLGQPLQPVGFVNATGVRTGDYLGGSGCDRNISPSAQSAPAIAFKLQLSSRIGFQSWVRCGISLQAFPRAIRGTAVDDDDFRRHEGLAGQDSTPVVDVFHFVQNSRNDAYRDVRCSAGA